MNYLPFTLLLCTFDIAEPTIELQTVNISWQVGIPMWIDPGPCNRTDHVRFRPMVLNKRLIEVIWRDLG